jgi:hypothetical protein
LLWAITDDAKRLRQRTAPIPKRMFCLFIFLLLVRWSWIFPYSRKGRRLCQ